MFLQINLPNIALTVEYCSQNKFVIFDIDNTIITPETDLGSDHWFAALIALLKENTLKDFVSFIPLALELFKTLQELIRIKPVENTVSKVISTLQEFGVPTIAVTSRGIDLESTTVRQLKEVNVDFSQTKSIDITPLTLGRGTKDQPISYSNGILYCSGNNKGNCTRQLFRAMQIKTQDVVMIDDNRENIQHTANSFESTIKHFTGLRYCFLDKKISQFIFDKSIPELLALIEERNINKKIVYDILYLLKVICSSSKYNYYKFSIFKQLENIHNEPVEQQSLRNVNW